MPAKQVTSDVPTKRRRLSREDRKRELLTSAVVVAADVGLSNLVHADIAKANNVVVATVFLYFPDAESLIRAVVNEVGTFYRDQCNAYLTGRNASPSDLQEYAAAFVDSIDTHPQYAAVFLQWAAAVSNEHGIWDLFLVHIQYLESKIKRRAQTLTFLSTSTHAHLVDTFSQLFLGSAFVVIRLKFSGASNKKLQRFLKQTIELLVA